MLNAIFQHLLQHMLSVFNLMFHFVCITHIFQNAGYVCVPWTRHDPCEGEIQGHCLGCCPEKTQQTKLQIPPEAYELRKKQPARSCPQRQVQAYDLQGREGRVMVGRVAPRSSDPQERLGESHAEEGPAHSMRCGQGA